MVRSGTENPFGHLTRKFPLRISRGRVTVTGNGLHFNLSITSTFQYWYLLNFCPRILQVSTISGYWSWVNNVLIPGLYIQSKYNGESRLTWREQLATSDETLVRVGVGRLRQQRLKQNGQSSMLDFFAWDPIHVWHNPARLKVGWRGRFLLADQNQHVSKPTWVKLQCNRHSRSALKSVLKMAKLAPSEKRF